MKKIIFGAGASRLRLKFLLDLSWWAVAACIALALHWRGAFVSLPGLTLYLSAAGLLAIAVILSFDLHRQSWHRIGVYDLVRLVAAVATWTLALGSVLLYLPASVSADAALVAGMAAVLLLGGMRVSARLVYQSLGIRSATVNNRVLIVGAGEAGTMMAREMLRHPEKGLKPVGFLDDNPTKTGQSFVGLPVLGGVETLKRAAAKTQANQVLIAAPSAPGEFVQRVVALARDAQITHRIVPPLADLLSGAVSISSIREVEIEDLLQREPVRLDLDKIAGYLEGKVVLVSGAGGSIGSEIIVQMARFKPRKVVLLGRGENSLFILERHLERVCPGLEFATEVCDVRRSDGLDGVFRRHEPEVVFHAAAHKHVPLMEGNAWESVFNNIGGTANLLNASLAHAVKHFVNVSTDKAVNPCSVMGASKRVAEYLVQQAARRAGVGESYVSVRFGNVLGSRGSVIPLFQQQIRHGGPVTLTHPDMTRYFMTIPEAAQLVLQAGGMNGNGSVYVLDMGEPVKIVDLANELIRLSGLVPGEDIKIVFRGMRPGEKLFEELLTAEEGTAASQHEKIFVAQNPGRLAEGFDAMLDTLFHAARRQDAAEVRAALAALVPTYRRPAGDVETEAAQPDFGWVRALPRSA